MCSDSKNTIRKFINEETYNSKFLHFFEDLVISILLLIVAFYT